MTLIRFPSSLPRFTNSYSIAPALNLKATNIHLATHKRRFINHNIYGTFNLIWNLHTDELGDFYQFLSDHGYGWFEMDMASGRTDAKLTTTIDEQLSPHKVRFINDPAVNAIGFDYFSVNIQAECIDVSTHEPDAEYLPSEYQAVIDKYGEAALQDICDNQRVRTLTTDCIFKAWS